MGCGSDFANTSEKLIRAMIEWKNSLSNNAK
jgi:hypothetical protein